MPTIKEIQIDAPDRVAVHPGDPIDVTVRATIDFSEVERNLNLNYAVRIALYEIDGQMDVYSVFPNNDQQILIQRAARGDKDDFLGFSRRIDITAQNSQSTIEHTFQARSQFETDGMMDIRALVVCTPDTATAMQWSGQKQIEVLNT